MQKYQWLRRALAFAPERREGTGWRRASVLVCCAVVVAVAGVESTSSASAPDVTIPRVPNPPLASDLSSLPGDLRAVAVPAPSNLDEFVKDPVMAIALGKALFWDMQVGSDGVQACASCHFQAGADNRVRNTMSPGLRNELGGAVSMTFNQTASNLGTTLTPPNGGGGPNYILKKADFPFHQLKNPGNRNSAVLADSDDVVSSQGVFHRDMVSLLPATQKHDACISSPSFFSV